MTHPVLEQVLARLCERSQSARAEYLALCDAGESAATARADLGRTNLAHSYAAATDSEKDLLRQTQTTPNLGIVTAYNDMLSAHQPYYRYPETLKAFALKHGATAQVAGGTPAMCDGVTQGQAGMELSLFSRDTIAMSTAIALSHAVFDGGLYLGICDKIVPGLLMGALAFGHMPALFVPSGPMHSGISNEEKAAVRVAYAEGKVDAAALLASEEKSYHSSGTCTFYGTANSNQMLLEMMGLQLPGSAFVHPHGALRSALNEATVRALIQATGHHDAGVGRVLTAANILNGVIGLLATGGSTNHTLHLVAIARCAGWLLTWEDFATLSEVIPTVTKLYPNGSADVNAFHTVGGTPAVIQTLAESELVFTDIPTAYQQPLLSASQFPLKVSEGEIEWIAPSALPPDPEVLRPASAPFKPTGGLKLLSGNLGRAIIKVSALDASSDSALTAPARVFATQEAIVDAFSAGELDGDYVIVLPGQGPAANGMPELHKLTPAMTSLLKRGFKVALVTDGRMSGASGKFPAAIHLTPEAVRGGAIGLVQDGDLVTVDWSANTVSVDWQQSPPLQRPAFAPVQTPLTVGRSLFATARRSVTTADSGACFLYDDAATGDESNG